MSVAPTQIDPVARFAATERAFDPVARYFSEEQRANAEQEFLSGGEPIPMEQAPVLKAPPWAIRPDGPVSSMVALATGFGSGVAMSAGAIAEAPEIGLRLLEGTARTVERKNQVILPATRKELTPEEHVAMREMLASGGADFVLLRAGGDVNIRPNEVARFSNHLRAVSAEVRKLPAMQDLATVADLLHDSLPQYLAQGVLGSEEAYSWSWWMMHGGEGLGTVAAAMAAAVPAAVVGGPGLAAVAGGMVAGAIEAGMAFDDYAAKLEEKGYSKDEAAELAALSAVGYGIAAGIVEVAPMARLFKRVPGLRGNFVRWIQAAVLEGGEESVQTILDNVTRVVSGIDEDALMNMTLDDLLQAFALGAVAAGGVAVVTSGAEQTKEPRFGAGKSVPATAKAHAKEQALGRLLFVHDHLDSTLADAQGRKTDVVKVDTTFFDPSRAFVEPLPQLLELAASMGIDNALDLTEPELRNVVSDRLGGTKRTPIKHRGLAHLSTDEGALELVEQEPEIAAKLTEKSSPSRQDIAALGLDPGRTNTRMRTQLVRKVRQVLEARKNVPTL
ncbi:MAG TPA: hypothetical protein VM285_14995, partial [Polyangia bacterium]|nr:hypothetical protein [Polyangia bacterium]